MQTTMVDSQVDEEEGSHENDVREKEGVGRKFSEEYPLRTI